MDTKHKTVIVDFLNFLNDNSDNYILKGGTALMLCYNLDRFSEDIDLDGVGDGKEIGEAIEDFCNTKGYAYRIAKDTETVKRYMLNYGDNKRPLKIETSFRKKIIDKPEFSKINGIKVYNINTLSIMKANAYGNRDRIRDLYDITFICNNYWEQLTASVKSLLRETILHKGIEQFDYLINNQPDELIDTDKLAENFLKMYEKLGLLAEEKELRLINRKRKNRSNNEYVL